MQKCGLRQFYISKFNPEPVLATRRFSWTKSSERKHGQDRRGGVSSHLDVLGGVRSRGVEDIARVDDAGAFRHHGLEENANLCF